MEKETNNYNILSNFSNVINEKYLKNVINKLGEYNYKIEFLNSRIKSLKNILVIRKQKFKNSKNIKTK